MASTLKFDTWQNSAGAARQTVLQVVQNHFFTKSSQAMTAQTATALTGFNASITPQTTSSRVLVMVRWNGEFTTPATATNGLWGLTRNGTHVGNSPNVGTAQPWGIATSSLSYWLGDADSTPESAMYWYVDSPASTSALTYQVTLWDYYGSTVYTNRDLNDTGADKEQMTSSITLMEISA